MMGRSLFSPAQNRISAWVAVELPGRRPRRRRAAGVRPPRLGTLTSHSPIHSPPHLIRFPRSRRDAVEWQPAAARIRRRRGVRAATAVSRASTEQGSRSVLSARIFPHHAWKNARFIQLKGPKMLMSGLTVNGTSDAFSPPNRGYPYFHYRNNGNTALKRV